MTTKDICWLAGLLEGEGCFGHTGNCVTLQLAMTDRDVVEKARRLVGAPSLYKDTRQAPRIPCYSWLLSGQYAAGLMMTLYSLLGERRQAKIRTLLTIWKQAKLQHRSTLVCQHSDAYRRGRTVCSRCYQANWYRQRKEGRRDVSSLAKSTL